MVDPVPGPFWTWPSQAWRIMDDLAEKIDDLICTFEGGGDMTMDTLAMYLFGWMFFGLFVLGVGKFVYSKFSRPKGPDSSSAVIEPIVAKSEVSADSAKSAIVVPKDVPRAILPSGGKYVPPTPPTRKRLGSKSGRAPGPVRTRSTSSLYHPPPTATGPEAESVKWVNELFMWLYSDLVIVNELLNVWIQSLNDFTRQSVTEHGVGVEFVRVLSESPPPNISNVFCECAQNDDVTITFDCETSPSLQIKVFRQRGEKIEVSHYRLNVNRFRARLHVLAITEKLTTDICCDGWPEIKVALAQVGAIRNNLDETQLQDVISDIVTGALRHTSVHLNLSNYPTCPRLMRYLPTGNLLPLHYDSMMNYPRLSGYKKAPLPQKKKKIEPSPLDAFFVKPKQHAMHGGGPMIMHPQQHKRLLVKIIKASGLGLTQGCYEPYCVVEIDEPPQKNQTSIKKDTNEPVWDEHFLFDVNQRTTEVLLEIYDRCKGGSNETKFLGLGIVSMDELALSPSQRQVIALQATPEHETNPVSGTLTVEFLLIEGPELPPTTDKPFKLKETLRSLSPTGAVVTTTKTVFSQPNQFGERITNGGDNLADSALRDLSRSRGMAVQPSKSTLIIHSVQRSPSQQIVKVEMTESGKWHEVEKELQSEIPQSNVEVEDEHGAQPNITDQMPIPGITDNPDLYDDRGRTRKRKRDFFGTLRQRLSRSKGRSKSAGTPLEGEDSNAFLRSISADRNRDPSAHSMQSAGSYLLVPGLREDSARSSLSEASGISGASSRTYVNEASTLVLETIENGIKKYYLVPLSLAQRSKWKKKGTKLHIFNDHTFIAKHLSGGTMCQVCKKMLARRLGKQGYECRDCLFKCHKQCHVKVETTCPNSNILNIELCSNAQSPYSVRKLHQHLKKKS